MSIVIQQNEIYGDYLFAQTSDCALIVRYLGSGGSVVIPDTIDDLPVLGVSEGAFANCAELTNVTLPSTLKWMGPRAFYQCKKLSSITIPGGVYCIERLAFAHCQALKSVTLHNGVASIDAGAFYNCRSLEELRILGKLTYIGASSFANCVRLAHFDVPAGHYSLYKSAFENCHQLESFSIPGYLSERDLEFISNNKGIKKLLISEGNHNFSFVDGALLANNNTELVLCLPSVTGNYVIPNSVTSIRPNAFLNCYHLSSFTVSKEHESFCSVDGVLYTKNLSKLVKAPPGFDGHYTIPEEVKSIHYSAFLSCQKITSIRITRNIASGSSFKVDDCAELSSITVCPENPYYHSSAGILFKKDKTTLQRMPPGYTGHYTISEHVESIYPDAFQNCHKLTSITIPDSFTSLSCYPFYDCIGLTSATVTNRQRLYHYLPRTKLLKSIIFADGLTTIGDSILRGRKHVVNVTIPSSVSSIGKAAFSSCKCLTEISLPSGVTSIGDAAFSSCVSLAELLLPSGVTSIGKAAFAKCTGMTRMNIPCGVSIIEPYTFTKCTNLSNVQLLNGIKTIGKHAFEGCSGLTDIEIPGSVESVAEFAFANCSSLTSIHIPDRVASIGQGAFAKCSALQSVSMPNALSIIEDRTFEHCSNLTKVLLPQNLNFINIKAFHFCHQLIAFDISEGNQKYSCQDGVLFNKEKTELLRYPSGKLGNYTVPDSVTIIGEDAFFDCPQQSSLTVSKNLIDINSHAFTRCFNFSEYRVAPENPVYSSCDGVLYDKHMTTLVRYPVGKSGFYEIPEGVQLIADEAFAGCAMLTGIKFPSSLTSIGKNAFSRCVKLKSVELTRGIAKIGDSAFSECTELISVVISNLGGFGRVFPGCPQITNVRFSDGLTAIEDACLQNATAITSITIPDSVLSIGSYAFKNCNNLTNIAIPNHVTTIGSGAFWLCTSLTHIILPANLERIEGSCFRCCLSLTSIIIPESVTSIGNYAFEFCSCLTNVTIENNMASIGKHVFSFTEFDSLKKGDKTHSKTVKDMKKLGDTDSDS